MKYAPTFALAVATGTLVTSIWVVAAPAATSAGLRQNPAASAEDPGTALFHQMCSDCHEAAKIVEARRTKDDWQEVINKMIQEGATGSGKDFENVFDYLLRHYGKLHINGATPDELTRILGLTRVEADAVIGYRAAHGDFADFDALKKVPEIDIRKLDVRKDAIAF